MKSIFKKLYGSIRQSSSWKKNEGAYYNFVNLWLKSLDKKVECSQVNRVGIIVQPWLGTAVPWFSITLALFMYTKGIRPLIIFDDLAFGADTRFFKLQRKGIAWILSLLSHRFDIKVLSSYESSDLKEKDKLLIEKLAEYNSISYCKGELDINKRTKYISTIKKQLAYSLLKIKKLYQDVNFRYIVLGGGIYGSSGLHFEFARLNGIRVTTFDSGFGILILSTNGIAAQLADIPVAFNMLDDADYLKIQSLAQKEFEERKMGNDKFESQVINYENNINKNVGILFPLNIVWDSAALGMMTLFKSTSEWITESIEWILKNTSENITIRQHPHERKIYGKSEDNYLKVIQDKFGNNSRIHFISCFDNVNTYNLIENSKLVICLSSTIGVEAAMMGIPVMVVSNCYYSELGFVIKPKSKAEYFNSIQSLINSGITLSNEQMRNAIKCYYLTQYCNWIQTEFTPVMDDFKKWIQKKPEDIFKMDVISELYYSLENNIPICIIQHKKFITDRISN